MADLLEHLWPHPQRVTVAGEFPSPTQVYVEGTPAPGFDLNRDLHAIAGLRVRGAGGYPLRLEVDGTLGRPESYRLTMNREGTTVSGSDEAGLLYGQQTLLQILALSRRGKRWPILYIHDWPAYRTRSFMVDLGRSVFRLPFLQRIVRILARLKMNCLHLHLYDDELCGLRFAGFPFGRENPHALSLDDLAHLVRYATRYHVAVVPELEGWGHVGSLVYHRPELRGGPGQRGGASFLLGPETFALMRSLVRQVAQTLPARAAVHLGLDEARLFPAPSLPADFSAIHLLRHYDWLVQAVGRELGKELTLIIWGDMLGARVPAEVRSRVIVQPWRYWQADADWIRRTIAAYSQGEVRWLMGGGQSVHQYRGAYHATRLWCRGALEADNVEGVNITFWGSNDLDRRMISLFVGAYYAWNPTARTSFADLEDYERFDRQVYPILYGWQSTFRDAFPDEMRRDRGEEVLWGFYLWGERHGRPVAPTAAVADTFAEHWTWVQPKEGGEDVVGGLETGLGLWRTR